MTELKVEWVPIKKKDKEPEKKEYEVSSRQKRGVINGST